jgi:hypothetical protein
MPEEEPLWPHFTPPSSDAVPVQFTPGAETTRPPAVLQVRYCETLREAEDLLDWLEANGLPIQTVAWTDCGWMVLLPAAG